MNFKLKKITKTSFLMLSFVLVLVSCTSSKTTASKSLQNTRDTTREAVPSKTGGVEKSAVKKTTTVSKDVSKVSRLSVKQSKQAAPSRQVGTYEQKK